MDVEQMCHLTCPQMAIHIECFNELLVLKAGLQNPEWLNRLAIHYLAMALPKYRYELLMPIPRLCMLIDEETQERIVEVTSIL